MSKKECDDMAELFADMVELPECDITIDLTRKQLQFVLNAISKQKYPSRFRRLELIKKMTNIVEEK